MSAPELTPTTRRGHGALGAARDRSPATPQSLLSHRAELETKAPWVFLGPPDPRYVLLRLAAAGAAGCPWETEARGAGHVGREVSAGSSRSLPPLFLHLQTARTRSWPGVPPHGSVVQVESRWPSPVVACHEQAELVSPSTVLEPGLSSLSGSSVPANPSRAPHPLCPQSPGLGHPLPLHPGASLALRVLQAFPATAACDSRADEGVLPEPQPDFPLC